MQERGDAMRKGFALIMVLVFLILIAIGTTTLLQAVGSHTNTKVDNVRDARFQYLAEACMWHALWQCRQPTGCKTEKIPIDGTMVAINADSLPKIVVTPTDYTDF